MAHPLVDQLRFTRSEWLRALRGVPEADGLRHVGPMNSIGWIVAHLAWQEFVGDIDHRASYRSRA